MINDWGFSKVFPVQGRTSIADLFALNKRCGLYILYFTNGEIYAGQAVDITRRYVQHRKVHSDIGMLQFRRLSKSRLNEEERTLIWALEQNGYQLRNITFTSIPKGESDFDLVMSPKEQEKWLRNLNYIDSTGDRIIDADLRRKYSKRFAKFSNSPYSKDIISILRHYVRTGIPVFIRSEVSFWSCSCLPSFSKKNITIYSRININWQEVMTLYEYERKLYLSIHIAKLPLKELQRIQKKYPSLELFDHFYEPGGQDQIKLEIPEANSINNLLKEKSIMSAMRLFNLRLMKKGACVYSRYHCMDLADNLVSF